MRAKILWVEGKKAGSPPFIAGLRKKGYVVETVFTGNEALARLSSFEPDMVVIDAASMRTSGKRICRSIHDHNSRIPIVMITDSERPVPADTGADVVLPLPFTMRKLINRIKPLLPGEGQNLLHIGSLRLDLERKRVFCQGREASLTPRLMALLKALMSHPGEALERGWLFRQVWNTEYTGDTRTLDVHISWLRQAIEVDPRHPELLKTIRGVGYRLDV